MSEDLNRIYYDPSHPAGFGGAVALARASGQNIKDVRAWLRGQASYTLHKPARIRFSSRKYKVSGIDDQFQADLVDMQAYAAKNDGFKHILTVIDMFSRYGWALPIKSKTAKDVKPAFESIFESRKPIKLQTDSGLEFESNAMQAFWNLHNIKQFSVKSQYKAAMVERFNRTLKTKMWRYFTHNNTHRWLEVLPLLVEAYNNSRHRIIKMAPAEVNKDNEMKMWMSMQGLAVNACHSLKVGDSVRLSKVKNVFKKGYLPSWTEEVFSVSQLLNTDPPQIKVKDYND